MEKQESKSMVKTTNSSLLYGWVSSPHPMTPPRLRQFFWAISDPTVISHGNHLNNNRPLVSWACSGLVEICTGVLLQQSNLSLIKGMITLKLIFKYVAEEGYNKFMYLQVNIRLNLLRNWTLIVQWAEAH